MSFDIGGGVKHMAEYSVASAVGRQNGAEVA